MAWIDIDRPIGMMDEPVVIRAVGFPPGARVTIELKMEQLDGRVWSASGVYVADGGGVVDLRQHHGHDPMALFQRLAPETAVPPPDNYRPTVLEPLAAVVTARYGEDEAKTRIDRLWAAPGGRRIVARGQMFVGALHLPPGPCKAPPALLLGDVAPHPADARAALIASHGRPCLAIALWGMKGLPAKLERIPLEAVLEAARWLSEQPFANNGPVALLGEGRGGELALLTAAHAPERFRGVVSVNGSGLVRAAPGVGPLFEPAWTWKGGAIDFLERDNRRRDPRALSHAEDGAARLCGVAARALDDDAAVQRAGIPVERIRGPVAMCWSDADQLQPSAALGDYAVRRLAGRQGDSNRMLVGKGAGHCPPPPYAPTRQRSFCPVAGGDLDLGGDPLADAAAGRAFWDMTLRTLDDAA